MGFLDILYGKPEKRSSDRSCECQNCKCMYVGRKKMCGWSSIQQHLSFNKSIPADCQDSSKVLICVLILGRKNNNQNAIREYEFVGDIEYNPLVGW